MLAYTGARFSHLKQWQMQVMPPASKGHPKEADGSHTYFAVKIEKAKCFDRIIPTYAGALMLAFGVPRQVVTVFVKLYGQLQKRL